MQLFQTYQVLQCTPVLMLIFDKTHVIWIGKNKYSSHTIKTKWKLVWGKCQFKLLGLNFHVDLDKMIDLNFKDKIKAIENNIKIWKRRYLSPIGKITVIKSLLIPTLTHLFISLPNPNGTVMAQLNKLFFDFLWQGPAKVKKTIITKKYEEGGLKMINLSAFVDSLKLSWVRRLLRDNNSTWKLLIQNKFNLTKLITCGENYSERTVSSISNPFWKDVLISYSKLLKLYVPKNEFDFLSSPLIYNHRLKIGGAPINFHSWHEKGIFYINDIINENGVVYTLIELQEKLKIKLNFLQHLGLTASINMFKLSIPNLTVGKKLSYPIRTSIISLFFKSSKGCRDFYNVLNKNSDTPTSKSKWENIYNIENETWEEIYSSPFKLPVSTLLQWFQFRINHRLLSTRSYLFKLKITDNPMCLSCQDINETIKHMLWDCPETKTFLHQLQHLLHTRNIYLNLNEELFIFNIGKQYSLMLLVVILEIKYYIFSSKRLSIPLSINAFKNKINWSFKTYERIAIQNKKLESFEKEYNSIMQAFK